MKFIGRFPYNAMVLQKRMRRPRREVLFGQLEYEIAEISKREMESGVVSVIDTWIYEKPRFGRYRERWPRQTDYWGWKGGLWAQPLQGNPWSAASLRFECNGVRPMLDSEQSPFARLIDVFHGREWDGVTMENDRSHLEENFAGEILSHERAPAAAAFMNACDDIVIAGREVLTRRREPTIVVGALENAGIGIMPWADNPVPRHVFRLDRLADAEEWQRLLGLRGGLSGQILRVDPAYLKRDDLSHSVVNWLPHLIGKDFSPFLASLPAACLPHWQNLAKLVDRAVAMPDLPLPDHLDVREVLDTLRTLQAELKAMEVQADHREARDKLLEAGYASFFRRVEFELQRTPLPEIDQRDAESLASMAL